MISSSNPIFVLYCDLLVIGIVEHIALLGTLAHNSIITLSKMNISALVEFNIVVAALHTCHTYVSFDVLHISKAYAGLGCKSNIKHQFDAIQRFFEYLSISGNKNVFDVFACG
jgi:hypothetical protein